MVYNHTSAAGQDPNSVLDKVVPGYYYRLDDNGDIYMNTCCPDTASEHRMFFKLMLDTLKVWAKEYQVDGFRFDLMSFSFKDNLLDIQKALHEIDPTIYLYGEGWNFGEVANNALGSMPRRPTWPGQGSEPSATAGAMQFAGEAPSTPNNLWSPTKGLSMASGTITTGRAPATLQQLLDTGDMVKLALAGTIKDYHSWTIMVDLVTGAQLNYDGQPAGYTLNPPDVINYISAHDNQTLFDNNQYKIPMATTMADRVRVNNLGHGSRWTSAGDSVLSCRGRYLAIEIVR